MPDIRRRRDIEAKVTASRRMRREAVATGPPRDPRASPAYRSRQGPADEEGYTWVVPTTSSNPARPRTKQAAYSRSEKTLRVEFRDGTPWNYYDVSPTEWDRFKRSASPGRFINRVLNQHRYEQGDWSP